MYVRMSSNAFLHFFFFSLNFINFLTTCKIFSFNPFSLFRHFVSFNRLDVLFKDNRF